jgi:hypothetical protein
VVSISRVEEALCTLQEVRLEANGDALYGFNERWVDFIKRMRLLTPQSYGGRVQNYLFRRLGWKPVDQKLDKGDVVNSLGQHFEVKVSLITETNSQVNMVQIRPWQDISGHYIFVVDTTAVGWPLTHFFLSRNEMGSELALLGTSAHGTKEATKDNANRELSIRLPWKPGADLFERWCRFYRQPSLKLDE